MNLHQVSLDSINYLKKILYQNVVYKVVAQIAPPLPRDGITICH